MHLLNEHPLNWKFHHHFIIFIYYMYFIILIINKYACILYSVGPTVRETGSEK